MELTWWEETLCDAGFYMQCLLLVPVLLVLMMYVEVDGWFR